MQCTSHNCWLRYVPRRSTTSWNKERWIKLKEQAKQHLHDCFYSFCRFPSSTSRNQDFLFSQLFFYIFLWTRITRDGTTKIFTLNRGGMWPTQNQERFLKIWKQLRTLKTRCLWIFFEFLRSAPNGPKTPMWKISSPFYCKKLSQNRAPSEKLCPFYRRYLKLWFSESTTWQIGWRRLGQSFHILQHRATAEQSFSAIEQPRAKHPWCMQQGYRQMKSRRAAMQGENTRRLATYLGFARREFTQGG